MIKVGFDVTPLQNDNKVRGMGVYTRELLQQLKKCKDVEVQEFTDVSQLKTVDIVHYPYFDLFRHTLNPNQTYPSVVTVPDITPLLFSKHYPPGIKGRIALWQQKQALKNVAKIITLSKASQKDIVNYFHFSLSKVQAIHLAPNEKYKVITDKKVLKAVSYRYQLPDKFALYVGSVNWNKNIVGLTQAALDANLDIYLVGKAFEQRDYLDHPELKPFAEFLHKFGKHPQVHILGFVDSEDLVALMNLASVFLFPSFYEGFGLPVLEAQACGLPVITSSISSLPEVGGEGAVYVNPYKIEEISGAIKLILTDSKKREELIKEGFKNVKQFHWEKTAEQTIHLYETVIPGH